MDTKTMDTKTKVAFAACAAFAAGALAPLVSLPVIGGVSAFDRSPMTALIIVALAAAGAWIVHDKGVPNKGLIIVGILAIAMTAIGYTYAAKTMADLRETNEDNPFATAFNASVHLSYGWLLLISGSLGMVLCNAQETSGFKLNSLMEVLRREPQQDHIAAFTARYVAERRVADPNHDQSMFGGK